MKGKLHQAVGAAEVEFGADVLPVGLHRAHADAKLVGDFLAGGVPGDQFQYAPFGGRQVLQSRFLLLQRLFLPAAAPFIGGCFLTGGGCFCVAGPFAPDAGVLALGGVMFFGGSCEGFN